MKFSIVVYSKPGSSAKTAYRFAAEALEQGHACYRLFFFNDGVLNCTNNRDEPLNMAWRELIQSKQLDAIACSTSVEKRGLTQRDNHNAYSVFPDYQSGGLAQLVDASAHSDKLLTFGG